MVLTVYFIHAEFKWDDVKVDKHRENYLGHSVKAPVGRWQKGKCYPLILPFYVSTVPVVFFILHPSGWNIEMWYVIALL